MNSNPSTRQKRPKIGLALGSGGARGLAHIGILKVLEEHNIRADYIAGSSIGALVGSLYSSGHSPSQMEKFVSLFPQKYWVDYTVPKMGFVSGDKLKEIVRLLTKDKNIEDLSIPLHIVATHLQKGERKVFSEGPICEAVRASCSIPGIFVPAEIEGDYYVDGGVIDRVPVSVVKDMGADIILAVDVSYYEATHQVRTIFDVIALSIDVMEREILKYRMIDADVVMRPDVGHYSTTMFSMAESIIKEGERTGHEMVGHLEALIQQWEGRE